MRVTLPLLVQIKDVDSEYLDSLALRLEGFSGRGISKLLISVQGAVYGSASPTLTKDLFEDIVQWQMAERQAQKEGYDLHT